MKALLSRNPGGPETLVLEEIPEPVVGPGEVRISVRRSGARESREPQWGESNSRESSVRNKMRRRASLTAQSQLLHCHAHDTLHIAAGCKRFTAKL